MTVRFKAPLAEVQSFNCILSSISFPIAVQMTENVDMALLTLCLTFNCRWDNYGEPLRRTSCNILLILVGDCTVVLTEKEFTTIMLSKCLDLLQKWIDWLQYILLQNFIYILYIAYFICSYTCIRLNYLFFNYPIHTKTLIYMLST